MELLASSTKRIPKGKQRESKNSLKRRADGKRREGRKHRNMNAAQEPNAETIEVEKKGIRNGLWEAETASK